MNLIETDAIERDDSHTQKQVLLIFLLLTTAPGDIRTARGCFLRGYYGRWLGTKASLVRPPVLWIPTVLFGIRIWLTIRIRPIKFKQKKQYQGFGFAYLNTDPEPSWCESATTGLQTIQASIISSHASILSVHGPPEPRKLLNFDFDADPDRKPWAELDNWVQFFKSPYMFGTGPVRLKHPAEQLDNRPRN